MGHQPHPLGASSAAVELAPHAVVITESATGGHHRLVCLNAVARRLLGEAPDGAPLADVLGGLPHEILDGWSQIAASGSTATAEQVPLRVGDREVALDLTLTPWRDQDSGRHGVVAHLVATTASPAPAAQVAASPGRGADADHRTTAALQEVVLPQDLPVVPGLDVAAAYLLADAGVGAGGDWYDVLPGRDGSVTLVVGDVVGRGVRATAVMAALRSVLRERLYAGADLAAALANLDAFADRLPEADAATVCVAQVDPATGLLRYCTVGHPPPMVVGADGSAAFLPASGAAPLGTGSDFEVAEHQLGEADYLVLYTDGAVERPTRSTSQNTLDLTRTLAEAVRDVPADSGPGERVGHLCQDALGRLVSRTGSNDDIALLVAQRVPPPQELRLRLPAEPGTVRAVRQEVGGWLRDLGVRDLDEMAVQHAVGEVVANAVEHPVTDAGLPAEVRVEASLSWNSRVVVAVHDQGRWRERPSGPEASGRGRGLGLARGFADRIDIDRTGPGTTVTIEVQVTRQAALYEGRGRTPAEHDEEMTVTEDGPGRLVVAGPVDMISADRLRGALLRTSVGGTAALSVELTGVTFLGSAGVRVLFEAVGWAIDHGARGADVRLMAAPGSPAQHVLTTVGLPYRTREGTDDDLPAV